MQSGAISDMRTASRIPLCFILAVGKERLTISRIYRTELLLQRLQTEEGIPKVAERKQKTRFRGFFWVLKNWAKLFQLGFLV